RGGAAMPGLMGAAGADVAAPGPMGGGGEAHAVPPAPAAAARESRIVARALEPGVAIEIDQLDPPYRRWSGAGSLSVPVPPGAYCVCVRLGADVYNEMGLMDGEGEEAVGPAGPAGTPALAD